MPIGVVIAGLFTAPLFVLIISAIFQSKSVGLMRWLVVGLGFLEALLVTQPDPSALDLVAFLPVCAGFFYVIGAIATRAWCEGEQTLRLTYDFWWYWHFILPNGDSWGVHGFPMRGWMPFNITMIVWYVVLSIGALIGIGFVFRGYQVGEASNVAVLEYALLIFASFWAWFLWGETVPALSLIGTVLIVGSGIIIVLRSDS